MAEINETYLRRYLNDVSEITVPVIVVPETPSAETSTTSYLRRYLNDPVS